MDLNIMESLDHVIRKVQINIPFPLLMGKYRDRFRQMRLNPEIYFDADTLDKSSFSAFEEAANLVNSYGGETTFHAPFIDLPCGSPDRLVRDAVRKRFETLFQLVPLFSPKSIVCHAGYDWKRYHFMRERWIEESIRTWTWAAEILDREDVQLSIENVYEHGPGEIRFLFEQIEAENVGLCLDVGHQSAFSKTSLKEWLDGVGIYIKQLHLHDNDGSTDAHLSPGKGTIPFQTLFQYLEDNQIEPIITLEPHDEADLIPGLQYVNQFLTS